MSESSANLTATTAVTGAKTSSSSFQENVPGGSGNASSEAGAVQNETATNNLAGQDSTTMAEGDKGNQKDAIIAILEEWAAWERGLEREAEKAKVARDTKKEIPGKPAPPVDESTPLVKNEATLQRNPKSSSQCVVTEFDDSPPAVEITPIPRRGGRGASKTALSATTGQLYATRRDRRRAEKNDPLAKTRREALKVWAADQTRRRSSAGDWPPGHSQVEVGLTLKNWVARRRSSAEAMVGQPVKGGSLSRQEEEEEQWKGKTAGALRPSVPPESRRRRPSPLSKKSSTATDKTVSQWRDSQPGRADRGRHEKQGRPTPDGIDMWEEDARTNPPTPRTPGSTVAGRASPWARSPSRETAGGILVKHCFFYGPAGKIAIGRSPNTTPSFESQWMRKFREEVQGNPNWWAGPGQYHPGRSTDLSFRSVFRRTSATNKRPAYPVRTAASTTSEKAGASRNTNLWDEVRSLLARSRPGGDAVSLAGSGGSGRGADAGATTPEEVDALSFGDRLRCTPLSQGAWLIDSAGDERSSSVGAWRDGDGAAISLAERPRGGPIKAAGGALTSSGSVQTPSEVVVAGRATVDLSHFSDTAQHPRGGQCGFREGESGGDTVGDAMGSSGGQRKSLQSVHEAILAKLRGEIDPFTREEIVLQAAEDAKGALARDQAHASLPRRSSAGVQHRLQSSEKAGSVPAPIDYDKVEATLSLIELASRAAGPDAGKQMLQALEGLDKIHQRVSDDEVAGENRDCASEEKADLQAGSVRGNGGDKGLTVAEASGDSPPRDDSPRDELSRDEVMPTFPKLPENKDESPAQLGGEEKPPQQRSRRISLAVSDMSDDNDMGSISTGVMQSIGNWLRRIDRRPSRQHSFTSATADMGGDRQQQLRGRERFPSALSIAPEEMVGEGVEAGSAEETESNEAGNTEETKSNGEESKEEFGEEEASPTRRVSVTAQRDGGEDQTSLADDTTNREVNRTSSDAAPKEEVDRAFTDATPNGEVDRTPSDAIPSVEVQSTDVGNLGPDNASLRQGGNDHATVAAAAESVPTATTNILAAEPDVRIQEIPIKMGISCQTDKAVSPPSLRKVVDIEQSKSPYHRHSPLRNNAEVHHYQFAEDAAGTQSVGPSLNGAGDRDSWMSVGTRPKRGVDGQGHKPAQDGARTDAGMKLFGDGRPRAKQTAVIGTRALAAELEKALTSGAPSKVCAKFVWPRPGRSIGGKRVNLASSGLNDMTLITQKGDCSQKENTACSQTCSHLRLNPTGAVLPLTMSVKAERAPGIVRRSPLIDAFHPEVAKQRAFRLTLRKAGQPDAPPPMTPKESQSVDTPPPIAAEEKQSVRASGQTQIRTRQDLAEDSSPASESIAGKASTRRRQRRPFAAQQNASPTMERKEKQSKLASEEIRTRKRRDVAESSSPAVSSIAGKAPTRRRERRPVSVAPPSFRPPSPATANPNAKPLPTEPRPSVGENCGPCNKTTSPFVAVPANEATSAAKENTSAEDAAAPGVGLTVVQCECAEEWMERAKCSLGPKVWECLGSSPAFYRIRDRFRRSLVPAGGCETADKGGRLLEHAPPVRAGEGESEKRGLAATSEALNGEGVIFGPTAEGWRLETENKAEEGSGWGDRLSQRAALVVDAIMWTILTERERSTVSAAILQDRKLQSECPRISALEAWLTGGDTSGSSNGDSKPMETMLAISWPRARRFAKSSSLVDGINVVDADIDLAFKRWEESVQAGRPVLATTTNRSCSLTRFGLEPPAPGMCTAAENVARVRSRDGGGTPRLCDAVGCSEGGRYGDICPTVKWRFCRKHRNGGMVDLGGRRCERVDCERLAVRVGETTFGSGRRGTLCSMHTLEDRVDLEGLASVLLALAETRRRDARRLATMAGVTPGNVSSEEKEDADTAAFKAPALRDLVLALTDQPLPPAFPAMVEAPSPRIKTCGGFGARDDAVPPSSATSPGAAARSVGGTGIIASATDTLLRPNGSRRLGGDYRTSDQVREYRELPGSGELGAAEYRSSPVPGPSSSSPSPGRDHPSTTFFSGSQPSPNVRTEPSFGGASVEMCEQSRQPQEEKAHGEGQPESEERGGGSGEGKGEECSEHKAWGRRIRSSLAGCRDDEFRDLGAENLNTSKAGQGDCAHRSSSTGTAWGGIRWRGVDEVLGRNARSLKAVFRRYSRKSGDAREMALPDVLRFCDAFELRPGLVSRREIIDGFKEVVYPGVMGLTDEEIGYSLKLDERRPSNKKPARSGPARHAAFPPTGVWGVSPQEGGDTFFAPAGPTEAATVAGSYGPREGGDEHCAYLPSGAPSLRVSTSRDGGGGGGRGKKTVYLGRSQKFPLRRVESAKIVASSDQDASSDSSAGASFRRRSGLRGSPLSRTGSHHPATSAACDIMGGEREAKDPPVAPSLSLPQFFEWMSEVVVKCPAPAKTFGRIDFARHQPNEKRLGRCRNGRSGSGSLLLVESTGKQARGAGVQSTGKQARGLGVESTGKQARGLGVERAGKQARGLDVLRRQNAAKAVVMLQWMELSRGMRTGGIPPFSLSSCFTEAAPPSSSSVKHSFSCSGRR